MRECAPHSSAEEQDDDDEDAAGDQAGLLETGRGQPVLQADDGAAPSRLPQRVPMPPRTVMTTTLPDVVQYTSWREAKPWLTAYSPPARPDRNADTVKTTSL